MRLKTGVEGDRLEDGKILLKTIKIRVHERWIRRCICINLYSEANDKLLRVMCPML